MSGVALAETMTSWGDIVGTRRSPRPPPKPARGTRRQVGKLEARPEVVLGSAGSYVELVRLLIARRVELGLSLEEVDGRAGWAERLASKLEAAASGDPPAWARRVSGHMLCVWLQALGLEIAIVSRPQPASLVPGRSSKGSASGLSTGGRATHSPATS